MPFEEQPPSTDYSCREITTEQDFHSLRGAWEDLFRQTHYPTPFATWEWAWQWWRHFAVPDPLCPRLLILMVTDTEGALAGIAPFYYPTWTGSYAPQRPLRLLGTRLRCRLEDMTDEPALLLRRGAEEPALAAIQSHLIHRRDIPWDVTHLQAMRLREAPGLDDLWRRRPRAARLFLARRRQLEGQIVPLPDSWPEFRRSLSRSMRDNLPYYPRLLDRRGHAWSVRTARTPAEVGAAADVLIDLHHRRARSPVGIRHEDHLPETRHEDFLRETLTALAARGEAAVWMLEVDGVPVAAQAVLGDARMITFHYSGFDPEWHAYSPLLILNARALEDAIQRGVPMANYLPCTEPWKTRWGATDLYVREEFSWVPLRPRPALRAAIRDARRALARTWPGLTDGGCDCGFCALPATRRPEPSHPSGSRTPRTAPSPQTAD